jgi:deoxyribonuclease V
MIRHTWSLTPREAMRLQRKLAAGVRIEALAGPIETVAGTDCAFIDGGKAVVAGAVLCDARTLAVQAVATAVEECRMPYIPGLLSFREAPAVIAAVDRLPCRPGLLLCDGQGLAHPRGFGLACHVGLWLGLPTIGVAKSRLCGEHAEPGPGRGCRRRLLLGGRVVGVVLRTQPAVRPLYVSVGHRVTLEDAIGWTLRCARRYRLPEPNRRAHHEVTMLKPADGPVDTGVAAR